MQTFDGMFSLHLDPSWLRFQFPQPMYATVSYTGYYIGDTAKVLMVYIDMSIEVLKNLVDVAYVCNQAEIAANNNANSLPKKVA